MKSPIKYAGGKMWLVPTIKELYLDSGATRIIEPFCGSCAISLGIEVKHALCNDINPHLINLFNWLKKGLIINSIFTEKDLETYNYNKHYFNLHINNDKYDAELFYYLNRLCFNGLCRFNKKGEFNVPYGKYKNPLFLTDLTHYVPVIKHWEFTSGDFSNVNVQEEDFVYIDSPYDESFVSYSKEGFTWDDQLRLANWASKLNVPAVLSNKATDRIIELYSNNHWSIEYIDARRRISCDGNRDNVREILISNYCLNI